MRCLAALPLLLASILVSPAAADQTDPRLAPLFVELQKATSPEMAQPIEQLIWTLWLEHRDGVIVQLMARASSDIERNDYPQALAKLDQVVTLAPEYAEGWNRRATLYYLMGRYEDSLSDIKRVMELEPRHFAALSGKGLCLLELGRLEEAAEAFTAALALNPQLSGARESLEELRDELGQEI